MIRSTYHILVAVTFVFMILTATSCEKGSAGGDIVETGSISLKVVPDLVNYHAGGIEWESSFQDTTTLRYLLALWPADSLDIDTLHILDVTNYEMPQGSEGAQIPITGLNPGVTYYVWMAAFRQTGADVSILYESPKTSFITCSSPYAMSPREPRPLTGMRGVGVDGRLYVLWPDGQFEEFDTATDTWTTLSPVPVARQGFAMVNHQKTIYVFGGDDSRGVDMYDPASGIWTTLPDIPGETSVRSAVSLGDTIYTFASYDRLVIGMSFASYPRERGMMAYDPVSGAWSDRGGRPGHEVIGPLATLNDTLYMFGSYGDGGTYFKFLRASVYDTIYRYVPGGDGWRPLTDLLPNPDMGLIPYTGAGYDVAAGDDGLYLVGGVLGASSPQANWTIPPGFRFDGDSEPWELRTIHAAPLDFGSDGDAVSVNGAIYFVNGGSRWPAILGRYIPSQDDCGIDVFPTVNSVPYGIPYETTLGRIVAPSSFDPQIHLDDHRQRLN
jgi:hypothetical protein